MAMLSLSRLVQKSLGRAGLRKILGKLNREQINVFSLLQDEIVEYSNFN